MDDALPVVIISGADHFRRRRFLQHFTNDMAKTREVIEVDGRDLGALVAAMSGAEFSGHPVLVVVHNASKVNLDLVEEHHKSKDNSACLALYYEGTPRKNTKFGKMVQRLKKVHKGFPVPKEWEAEDDAVDLCLEEARRHGKKLDRDLARALVSVTGRDLGLLSFEIFKLSLMANAQATSEITLDMIRGLRADVAEAQVYPIIQALEARDAVRLLRALKLVRQRSKTDPTIWVCRAVGSVVQRWLAVTNLDQQGVRPKEAALQLGLHPWFYENKVLPRARHWGQGGVVRLIRVLAVSERALLDGHVAPWTGLVARLTEVCSST